MSDEVTQKAKASGLGCFYGVATLIFIFGNGSAAILGFLRLCGVQLIINRRRERPCGASWPYCPFGLS